MVARTEIVHSRIPPQSITRIRALTLGSFIENEVTPKIGAAFSGWLKEVALAVSTDWPRKTAKSGAELAGSARVRYGRTLDTIRGYFLVSPPVKYNEYGTRTVGRNPSIAIPILDGVFPDGTPKRLGPNSWRSLKTFFYRSKKTGLLYIAYKSKGGELKLLYLLIDKKTGLKQLRKIRNMYDRLLPHLTAIITLIMQDAIVSVYNKQFIDTLNSIDRNLKVRKLPTVIPTADLHGSKLTPRY